jgi:hypothetical protein
MMLFRLSLSIGICVPLLFLTACGSGGGSADSSSTSINQNTQYISSNIAPNAISCSVQNIYDGGVNLPYVSVEVCQPGTTKCQTISNILLDTGSTGLRVFASALNDLPLTSQTNGGTPLAECATFISGVTWGSVKVADIKMSSEIARSISIQVIADPAYPTIPSQCSNGLPTFQTTAGLRANGILGVGLFIADRQSYYTCTSTLATSCTPITLSQALQVQNPVASFAINNNGVILQLPNILSSGASSVLGSLYFGIDTQSNNSSAGANIIPTNSSGFFLTTFNGTNYRNSFIDSGSNGLFFPTGNQSAVLTPCSTSPGFYCPSTTQSYSARVALQNNTFATIDFSIANAQSLFSTRNAAFSNLGGELQDQFDWGLPFFYGKTVYFGIAGRSSRSATGPYYGYKN